MEFKDKIYTGMLASICESMDNLVEGENFDMKEAKRLQNIYVKLVNKTCVNISRSNEDIDSWYSAFSQLYRPSNVALDFRILSELKKAQNLQSKTEEVGK